MVMLFWNSAWINMRMRSLIFVAICCYVSYYIRGFLVTKYEPVLHDHNSYSNLRAVKMLLDNGGVLQNVVFDDKVWYPFGQLRGKVQMGLVFTATFMHTIFRALNFTKDVTETCIYFSPVISAFTSIATYLLSKQTLKSEKAALMATGLMAIIPGYVAQSKAGSFDVEGLAICQIVLLCYYWVMSAKTGSILYSAITALLYGYLSCTWDMHAVISNMLALYVIILILAEQYSHRVYCAYTTFYSLAMLLEIFLNFSQSTTVSIDQLFPLLTFVFLHLYAFASYARSKLSPQPYEKMATLCISTAFFSAVFLSGLLVATNKIGGFSPRLDSFVRPSYAKKYYPEKVHGAENQAAAWAAFFIDGHLTIMLIPVAVHLFFVNLDEEKIFLLTYLCISMYCAATQISAISLLTPCACILSGYVIASYIELYITNIAESSPSLSNLNKKMRQARVWEERTFPMKRSFSFVMIGTMFIIVGSVVSHSFWVAYTTYADATVFLTATGSGGDSYIFDDFRTSYSWMRENTPVDSKVLSWSDHGYHINSMAGRTTFIDSSFINSTQLVSVGQIFSSSEKEAYPLLQHLDVDYVVLTFGGMVTWGGDDINKFLWMCRISQKDENEYKNGNGEFRIDSDASPKWMASVLYKLAYYRYGQLSIEKGQPTGWDRVRQAEVGNKDYPLDIFDEVFTSEHWLVRIFKVKKPDNLGNSFFL